MARKQNIEEPEEALQVQEETKAVPAEPIERPEDLESPEDLQRQMADLQAKLDAALQKEEEEAREFVVFPVADIVLKVGHGNTVPKTGVTPAEVAILAAVHHQNAKGNPIVSITPTGTIKVDPIDLKRMLVGKYTAEKVAALFPGPNPAFPIKFARAVKMGTLVTINPSRLIDFHVVEPKSAE